MRAIKAMARHIVGLGARSVVVKGDIERAPPPTSSTMAWRSSNSRLRGYGRETPTGQAVHTRPRRLVAWPGTGLRKLRSPTPRTSLPRPSAKRSPSAPGMGRCIIFMCTGTRITSGDRQTCEPTVAGHEVPRVLRQEVAGRTVYFRYKRAGRKAGGEQQASRPKSWDCRVDELLQHFGAAFADDLVEHLCRNVFAVSISEAMRPP